MSNPGPATTTSTPYGFGGGQPAEIGTSATDLVGFYGVAGVAQASAITAVTTTGATTTAPFGYSTSTQANAIVSALNSVITALHNIGITG